MCAGLTSCTKLPHGSWRSASSTGRRPKPNQEKPLSSKLLAEPVVEPHFPLAALVWPGRTGGASQALRALLLIALGTALLTLSAKINLPLPSVPMTLQTLVVL